MTTISDVAKLAGVSRSTVSRVINNYAYTSEETREHVLKAIKALNYRPNLLARSLVKQRTGNILVIAKDTLADAFYSALSEALMESANESGYNLLFYVNKYNDAVPLRFLDSFYGNVDGMIFLAAFRILDRSSILYLKKLGIPMVLIHSDFGVPGVAEVNVDNYSGSYLATEKLIALGHKRIGYASSMRGINFEMKARLDAYRQAMSDNGLPVEEDWIVYADMPAYTHGHEIAPTLFRHNLTAALCSNDMLAFGIYRWATDNDIAIPKEFSLVGFDDILSQSDPERMIERSLNSVQQPLQDMAGHTMDTLVSAIENGTVSGNRIFPVKWVERGTVARVPVERTAE